MKLSQFLFSYLLVGLTSTAAQASYDFINTSASLCPGSTLRVLSVTRVGLTRSGGCCGTDEEWSPTGGPGPFLGPRDMRGEFQARLQGYNIESLGLDSSFARLIDPAAGLMEKAGLKGAKVVVCLNQIDLASVLQTHASGTVVAFNLGFKVFLNMDSPTGRQTVLVQELAGSVTANSDFYHMYYDGTPRPEGLITNSWPTIKTRFDQFLRAVANAEADQNLQAVRADMADYIGR